MMDCLANHNWDIQNVIKGRLQGVWFRQAASDLTPPPPHILCRTHEPTSSPWRSFKSSQTEMRMSIMFSIELQSGEGVATVDRGISPIAILNAVSATSTLSRPSDQAPGLSRRRSYPTRRTCPLSMNTYSGIST